MAAPVQEIMDNLSYINKTIIVLYIIHVLSFI
jgi:hypothetical protein